jgi:uncharacterized damage-inducible protein DinB
MAGSRARARDLAVFMRATAGRTNWGHPGLAKMLRGVTVREATWKPVPGAHSIWEEVNHIAYWSRYVLERLEGRSKSTPQAWPAGTGSQRAWRRAATGVLRMHATLARRVATLDDARLGEQARKYTTAQLVLGNVAHMSYHIGQIALLKRLYRHAQRAAGQAV